MESLFWEFTCNEHQKKKKKALFRTLLTLLPLQELELFSIPWKKEAGGSEVFS